ncbi:FKBP-type peptidyl-prolyl cis-trans isomerase [Xanthomonas sacchari]|uniref:Peptidyl-prolyl cis-trans isomerase n=1 Tax=Xanthomonas sacchari TaxID=56458 RepID=A0A2P5Z2B8_9XANT|nr:FKBP-type peptidyl-prolyl cis-trans isomerase [Xanthomonas sacchari]MDV0439167.1 FKBP-type peptidyl-prolyl cis-trans isomerase [Xanthomonas sacchari]PPU81683.1 peptidylprolyl isomerase [Xanthomonas sacchari]
MRRILLLLSLSLPAWLLSGCTPPGPPPGGSIAAFQATDERVGDGAEARPGSRVTVHYTGWLYDEHAKDKRGEKFDASADHGQPFSFVLGGGQVIRGWDEGVAGMRVGGKRLLMLPSDYGYGDSGAGGVIPPGASLVFEVELLDVQPR